MLKILQARLQQYVNRELPHVQAGFRKGRGTQDQIANIQSSLKTKSSRKKKKKQQQVPEKRQDSSALLTTPKPLTAWITTNWKILKEMGIPDHLICLLRNLYAREKATVRT